MVYECQESMAVLEKKEKLLHFIYPFFLYFMEKSEWMKHSS